MKTVLVMTVALCLGCGLHPSEEQGLATAPEPGQAAPELTQAVPPQRPVPSPPSNMVFEGRPLLTPVPLAAPALIVDGSGFPIPDGAVVKAALGVMGCGFWLGAKGEAVVENGAFTASLHLVDEHFPMSYGVQTFLFADHDGDGACDVAKGDQVWSVSVPPETSALTLDAAELEPAPQWSCFVFGLQGV